MQAEVSNINISKKAPIYKGKIKRYYKSNTLNIYPGFSKANPVIVNIHFNGEVNSRKMCITNAEYSIQNNKEELVVTFRKY